MGATRRRAKCAASRGADIRLNAGVREIIIENGVAVGAVTA
jgi:phytoene dehydrogenase-like protein